MFPTFNSSAFYVVDVEGYVVAVTGYVVDVKGYVVDVKGYVVDVEGYVADGWGQVGDPHPEARRAGWMLLTVLLQAAPDLLLDADVRHFWSF